MGSTKISKPLVTGMAKSYYDDQYTSAQENYYSDKGKAQGEWFGRLAEQWGLQGGVTREQYDRLVDGQHPETGEQLVRWVERESAKNGAENEHRAGYDFTIAPHKSISAAALIGGDERLVALHERAVRFTMKAAEEYSQARIASHSAGTTGNLIAAMFTHDTARPVGGVPDPHLHTHVVVFNMTDDGGQIRSVQPLEWYRIQRYLDAVYQAQMAIGIQELGYTLERNLDGKAAVIAGYSPDYIESISRRHTEIDERKKDLGFYGAKAEDIIAHQTREAKVNWSRDDLKTYHRAHSIEYGIDPDSVVIAAKREPGYYVEHEGAHDAISFARNVLSDRNAVFDHYEIMEQALRYGLGSLDLDDVRKAFDERKDFVETHHYRDHAPGSRHTTQEMLRLEREVMDVVAAGRDTVQPIAPELNRDVFRDTYQHTLSNQQLWLSWNILTTEDRIVGVQGGAGVGKTHVLNPTRHIIEEHGHEVIGVAPTSRAASELTEAGITNSMTLHRYLGSGESKDPTAKPRVLFLDESSLASTVQVHALLETLRPQDRMVLVGDIRQHQSVEAGRVFEQLQQSGMTTFKLNQIIRQKDAPNLLEAVKEFSKGQVKEGLSLFEQHGWIVQHPYTPKRYQSLADDFALNPTETVGVSPDNDSVNELNLTVRERLQHDGLVKQNEMNAEILRNRQDLTPESKRQAFSYDVGDRVRFIQQNKELAYKAGEYATVDSVDRKENKITVQFSDGRSMTYEPHAGVLVYRKEERQFSVGDRVQFTQPWRAKRIDNRDFGMVTYADESGNIRIRLEKAVNRTVSFNVKNMPHIDYAYVLTSYNLQGASRNRVLVHVAANDTRVSNMLDKVFANVAVSRSKLECKIYCDDKEALLPALERLHLKPKAHSREQIRAYRKEPEAEHEHNLVA